MGFEKEKLNAAFWNVFIALFYLLLVTGQIRQFLSKEELIIRFSSGLIIFECSLAIFLSLARELPKRTSYAPWDIIIAIGGTLSGLLFDPKGISRLLGIGVSLQIVGNFFAILSFLSLGRSFGVVPAERSVKTQGGYRFVRHPLYASYQISHLGILIAYFSYYNLCIALISLLCQIARIYNEERLLMQNSEYLQYAKKVRWRLIPYVF